MSGCYSSAKQYIRKKWIKRGYEAGFRSGKIKLLSLAYFLVIDGESSMYRYEKFAKAHATPYGKPIASQTIRELFAEISEDEKMRFFKLRIEKSLENEYLAYDTTSFSSYSETMSQVKYGHNKDLESLPQL